MLYFGDHPYTDLADVTLEHGWRTGAILSELTVSMCFGEVMEYGIIIRRLKSTAGIVFIA